jgi:uncharacterized protein YidB (DUF937 family)
MNTLSPGAEGGELAGVGVAQKAAAIACILVGGALVVGGLTEYSPERAASGDRLISLVAQELTDRGLEEHAVDLNRWERGSQQLETETLPWLAARLGVSSDELTADLRSNVPEFDAAAATLPVALPFARKILDNLTGQQDNFRAARSLPVAGVSLEAASWLLVLSGIVTATLGVLCLLIGASWPRVGLLLVGLMLVLGPIVVSFTSKADQAGDLLETLNFDRAVAVQTREFFEVTRDLFASVDSKMLPYVAERGGIDGRELITATHTAFPTLASTLEHQAESAARFEARVRIREQAIGDLNEVKKVPLRELGWFVMAGGVIVMVAGIGSLVLGTRKRGSASRSVNEAPRLSSERPDYSAE